MLDLCKIILLYQYFFLFGLCILKYNFVNNLEKDSYSNKMHTLQLSQMTKLFKFIIFFTSILCCPFSMIFLRMTDLDLLYKVVSLLYIHVQRTDRRMNCGVGSDTWTRRRPSRERRNQALSPVTKSR